MTTILVFGDSISYGAWDPEGGWVQRLRKYLDEKQLRNPNLYFLVCNLGISGDTTEDILQRFEFETKQRIDKEDETIIIFAVGANDTQWLNKENTARVSEKDFEQNIIKLIKKAKEVTQHIYFVGILPVDGYKLDPIPWAPDRSYKEQRIEKFNDILKECCINGKVWFIPLYREMLKVNYKAMLQDGVHPTAEGHKIIFETVKNHLSAKKII